MGKTTGLPVGLDKTFDGNTFVMTIADMTFTPRNAIMNALIDVKIPGLKFDLNKYLVLSTENISFSPTGLGTEGKALLAFDLNFVLTKDNEFDADELIIKGKNNKANNLENSTYIQWDCHGFKQLNIALEYKFSRKTIIPDDEANKGRVVAKTTIKTKKGMNIIGKVDIESFQLPIEKLKGYAFKVTDAYIDLSTIGNPNGLNANLPKNYKSQTLGNSDPRLGNLWKGFWLKKMEVKIPTYIGNVNKNNRNTKVAVENMIVDKTGLTASFLVRDLIKWQEIKTDDTKNIDGCAFSIDTFYLDILQNQLVQGGLAGNIGLPIMGEKDRLHYKGILDNSVKKDNKTHTTFDFSISTKKDIDISVLAYAKLKIKNTSTIMMSLGHKSYINVDLSGIAQINSDSLSEDVKKVGDFFKTLGVKMDGIKIDNLKYNSTDGIISVKDFTYSLASPQKSVAGFPISVTKAKLTPGNNPSLTFDLGLNLMSKNKKGNKNGFSGKTRLIFKTELKNGNIKTFKLKEVSLDSIGINVEVSQVKFSGDVVFYDEEKTENSDKKDSNNKIIPGKKFTKKGFRGKLKLTLPANISAELDGEFGSIKYDKTKIADTKEWYTYWRIYGKANLGNTGIPIFSGVSLYGLGGGVYHHMTSTLAKGKYTYKEDFNSNLGLQFEGTIGSSDNGKSFVSTTKIAAEFTKDWGLKKFTFAGKLSMMNESLKARSSKISGNLNLTYESNGESPIGNRKALDKSFVHGNFNIDVNLGVIKGAMDGNSNRMVLANFYSRVNTNDKSKKKSKQLLKKDNDKGYWFFNMGTPQKRGKLKIDFSSAKSKDKKKKGKKNSKPLVNILFTSYLMAGHDIPSQIPLPSKGFQDIVQRIKSFGGKDLSDGGIDKLTSGKKDKILKPGQGFAFGSSASFSLNTNPVPFYVGINAEMGFDINYTKEEDRICHETGNVPGDNGWYASGQLYAGIEGRFGLKIDLGFIRDSFEIFHGAATMLLKGGFPNPNWAYGQGDLGYSVLNGVFKGNFHFEFDVGQHCTFTSSSAGKLAALKFIQSIKPSDKEKDVDVFSECTAAFAMPVNKTMKFPVENNKIKVVMPYIYEWSLTNQNGYIEECEDVFISPSNIVATLSPKSNLKGNTKYVQKLELRAKELLSAGNWITIKNTKGKIWSEKQEISFTTDKEPDIIMEKNVFYTYPFQNQRAFLKEETKNNNGYIVQKQGVPNLFKKKNLYVARFIKIDGSDYYSESTIGFEDNYRILNFDISSLENDKYYSLQIIEKKPKGELRVNTFNATGMTVDGVDNSNINILDKNVKETNLNLLTGSKSTLTSDVIKNRELPGTTVKSNNERVLYSYYFKTSKYNTFKQKINGNKWDKKAFSFLTEKAYYNIKTQPNEPLEQYDVKGYQKKTYKVESLVTVFLNDDFNKHKYNVSNYPTNNYLKYRINKNVRNPVKNMIKWLRAKKISTGMIKDIKMKDFVSILKSETFYLPPISKSELSSSNNPTNKNNGVITNNGNNNNWKFNTGSGLGTNLNASSFNSNTNYNPTYPITIRYKAKLLGMNYLNYAQEFISRILSSNYKIKYLNITITTTVKKYLLYKKYFKDIKHIDKFLLLDDNVMKNTDTSSFILQYRYPIKKSYKNYRTGKKVKAVLNKGTSIKVNFSK